MNIISGFAGGIIITLGLGFAFVASAFGAPTVTTNDATNMTNTTATFNGSVNPNGITSTAGFEYWTDNVSFSDKAMISVLQNFDGTSDVAYSQPIFNLRQNTTYYYRAAVQNFTTGYFWNYGSVRTFTTGSQSGLTGAPMVTTETPTNVFQGSATLRANVNPNNDPTTVWFEYGPTQSLGSTVANQSIGSGAGLVPASFTLGGLQANTTYYYRAAASNSRGLTRGNIISFVAGGSAGGSGTQGVPSVTTDPVSSVSQNYTTFNGTVNSTGGYATEAWFEYGPTQSLGSFTPMENIGSGSRSFSRTVDSFTPNATYYVQAVARNPYGTVRGSMVSFVTNYQYQTGGPYYGGTQYGSGQYGYGSAPSATTRTATFVSARSAIINGSVTPNNEPTTVWFEWGPSISLGNTTDRQMAGNSNSSISTSFVLASLSPNTRYYFRVVAESARGTQRGEVLSFTTTSVVVTTPPRTTAGTPTATVQGAATGPASIVLTPSVDNNNPAAGDTIRFSVLYKNVGTGIARDATIKIIYPVELQYISADVSPRNEHPSYLVFALGDLDPGEAGAITITFRLKDSVLPGTALVLNIVAEYMSGTRISEAASTFFALNVAALEKENKSFFAAIFSGLSFDWILLFVGFLLAILFLFYWFVMRKKREEEEEEFRTA